MNDSFMSILRCWTKQSKRFVSRFFISWTLSSWNSSTAKKKYDITEKNFAFCIFFETKFERRIFDFAHSAVCFRHHNELFIRFRSQRILRNSSQSIFFLHNFILISKTLTEFSKRLNHFSFSSNWKRIQSFAVHIKSWNMSECDRASVIIFIMLRCWFRNYHVRLDFQIDLQIAFFNLFHEFRATENFIVHALIKFVKSNLLISIIHLSTEERKNFEKNVFDVRTWFSNLMKAKQHCRLIKKSTRKNRTVSKLIIISRRSFFFMTSSIDSMSKHFNMYDSSSQINTILESNVSIKSNENEAEKLSNFHIAVHFQKMMKEYDIVWNENVLFEEDKHKFFKKIVTIINHRDSVMQVMYKNNLINIIKYVLKDFFFHTDLKLFFQLIRLRFQCFLLTAFENSFKMSLDFEFAIQNEKNVLWFASFTHLKSCVRNRLKTSYVQRRKFFMKITIQTSSLFLFMMRAAFESYDMRELMLKNKFLYWYEKFFFTDQVSNNWYTFYVKNAVQIETDEFVCLQHIFTHCLSMKEIRRIFFLNSNVYQTIWTKWNFEFKFVSIDKNRSNCFIVWYKISQIIHVVDW